MAPIAEESLAIERDAKLSYDSFKLEKSGDDAVRGAASGSALKSASGIADFRAARDIAYSGEGKGRGRLMFENRIIDGKTFHLAGNLWIDDDARDDSDKTIHELKFASKEYFDFLEKHPEVIPWLSLGPDVDVIHQGKVIRCRR
ncbi:MAG: hypothetical protein H8E24_11905 [Verrucomicrobia bacterium]|nr:hypothetical protein [Verrucomicrobiota bacterium]